MTPLPSFSIVIPTYRRPERLASCLRALAELDYPRDRFEVIVVDDDCMPEAGWLRALAARAGPEADQVLGGRTVNALADNSYSSATQLLLDYLYEWHAEHGGAAFFASNNLAVPTALFRAHGGFDVRFPLAAGEDREFCHRWARAGGRLVYAPDAVVRHGHHLTLASFWRQHVNYGRGALRFHRLRARLDGGRGAGTPLSFYLRLVAYPMGRARGGRWLTLTALLSLAQIATAAGYWRERLRV
jgi:GT2 family glycosyltransferase